MAPKVAPWADILPATAINLLLGVNLASFAVLIKFF